MLLIADAGTYNVAGIIPVSHGGADSLPVTIRGIDPLVFAPGSRVDDVLEFSSVEGDRIDLSGYGAAAADFTTTVSADGISIHVGHSTIVVHDVFALHPHDLILL